MFISPRRAAVITAVVLSVLAALACLYRFRLLAFLLILAIALVAAVRAIAAALETRGVPSAGARALAVTGTLLVLAGGGLGIGLLLAQELPAAVDHLASAYRNGLESWARGSRLERTLATALAGVPVAPGAAAATSNAALAATTQALEVLLSAIIIIVLALYWSGHRRRVTQLALNLMPIRVRPVARRLGADIELGVGLHILKEIGESVALTLVLAAAFHLLDFPFGKVAAFGAGFLRLVPLAGLPLGLTLVALLGAGSSAWLAATGAAITLVASVAINHGITRLLAVREYNQVLAILCLLLLFRMFGWFGLLLAPPVAAAAQITLEAGLRWRRERASIAAGGAGLQTSEPRDLDEVRARVAALQNRIASMPRPVGRATLNAFAKLRYLAARVDSAPAPPVSRPAKTPARRKDDVQDPARNIEPEPQAALPTGAAAPVGIEDVR